MTLDDFQCVISSKVEGTWNLHEALSSAAANVFLDGFMEYRRLRGLPGTSIDLTAVRDVGYLAEVDSKRQQEVLKNIGTDGMAEAQVLAILAAAITGTLSHSCAGQCITGLSLRDSLDHFWARDAKFTTLYERAVKTAPGGGTGTGTGTGTGPSSVPLNVQLARTPSREAALALCYEALAAKLAQVLVISVEDMDPAITVASLGLDSLVAIEIRNWIAREANANVQVLELLSSDRKSVV